jgi:hypothetical protein
MRLSQPSLELLIDVPRLETLTDPPGLEFELLVQEDRLDEAEALAKDRLRRDEWNEGYLCRVHCERGRTEEGTRCFRQLLGTGLRANRWGRAAARCAWDGHDLEEAEHAAYSAHDRGVMAALEVVATAERHSRGVLKSEGQAEFERMLADSRTNHDVLAELQLQLLLGSAEMRAWSTLEHVPAVKARLDRGRRRLQSLVTEGSKRGFLLLARKAALELKRDPFPPPYRKP